VQSLDYALVHAEQTYVQNYLDKMPPHRRANLIAQSNAALNGSYASAATVEARQRLDGKIDFANQAHRELIGRITVEMLKTSRIKKLK
jgi:LPS O-antigen subunit length determinant protein (WzzB/FepE family)